MLIDLMSYIKQYDSISRYNYIDIVLDIYNEGISEDTLRIEKEILTLFENLH